MSGDRNHVRTEGGTGGGASGGAGRGAGGGGSLLPAPLRLLRAGSAPFATALAVATAAGLLLERLRPGSAIHVHWLGHGTTAMLAACAFALGTIVVPVVAPLGPAWARFLRSAAAAYAFEKFPALGRFFPALSARLGTTVAAAAVFAFGLVAFGFLGMGPVTIAVDSYGPVTDNAQSVFELSTIEQIPGIKADLKANYGINNIFLYKGLPDFSFRSTSE